MDIKRIVLSAALLGLAAGAFAQGAGTGAGPGATGAGPSTNGMPGTSQTPEVAPAPGTPGSPQAPLDAAPQSDGTNVFGAGRQNQQGQQDQQNLFGAPAPQGGVPNDENSAPGQQPGELNGVPPSVVPPQSSQPQPFSPQGTTQTPEQP